VGLNKVIANMAVYYIASSDVVLEARPCGQVLWPQPQD